MKLLLLNFQEKKLLKKSYNIIKISLYKIKNKLAGKEWNDAWKYIKTWYAVENPHSKWLYDKMKTKINKRMEVTNNLCVREQNVIYCSVFSVVKTKLTLLYLKNNHPWSLMKVNRSRLKLKNDHSRSMI